jgi:Bromodomain extra-terminal - transcription regulation
MSLKRRRFEEVQTFSTENANAMAAIVAAAPQGVPNSAVSRGEFNMMIHMIQLLQKQIIQTHTALAELSPGDETDNATVPTGATTPSFDMYASLSGPESGLASAPAPERKKPKKKVEPAKKATSPETSPPPVAEQPSVVYDDTKPLTLQEQETLTETINNMPADHIPGVIQIIRESASLNGDEDEIDLEIDQLDTVTQRKLLRHVSKVRHRRVALLALSRFDRYF